MSNIHSHLVLKRFSARVLESPNIEANIHGMPAGVFFPPACMLDRKCVGVCVCVRVCVCVFRERETGKGRKGGERLRESKCVGETERERERKREYNERDKNIITLTIILIVR